MFRKKVLKKNNQSGVTLVELLIYMGLLAILLVVITDMFVSIINVQAESQSFSSIDQDGRYIMNRLTYDITRASDIITPASAGDTSNSLVLTIGGVSNTYAVSSGNLQLSNETGTSNLNSSETSISGVTFLRLGDGIGNDSVKMNYTVTSNTRRDLGFESRDFTTTVSLRTN